MSLCLSRVLMLCCLIATTLSVDRLQAGDVRFPRRALLISVNNYLLLNPVHYGNGPDGLPGGYAGSSTAVLRERLTRLPMHFPASQVVELSDGIAADDKGAKAHPTTKAVLETTIQEFVESSREQDRVLILFVGHAALIDGVPYLVPLDGTVKGAQSLIPLNWVYDQLAKCKAQQKVLILDVFRSAPARGFELPGTGEGDDGMMPAEFEKALEQPPAGVQVWSCCRKKQTSVELESGSAFLHALSLTLQSPVKNKRVLPADPIPVEWLMAQVNVRLRELLAPEKRTQGSRLTGKPREGVVLPNLREPLPAPLTLKHRSTLPGAADDKQVESILEELRLPPVRPTRNSETVLLRAQNLPTFSAKVLAGYPQDGYQSVAELHKLYQESKPAFKKNFPLRAAVFEASSALEESARINTPEILAAPLDPKSKAAFLQSQADPGISIFKLDLALAMMKEMEEAREKEVSRRWQANFDYTLARTLARSIYLYEYNYTLGQIRADNLPELHPAHTGWRIGTTRKFNVTEPKAKAYLREMNKRWQRLQLEYPDTPWAVLAQHEMLVSHGLHWRPKSD